MLYHRLLSIAITKFSRLDNFYRNKVYFNYSFGEVKTCHGIHLALYCVKSWQKRGNEKCVVLRRRREQRQTLL